MGKKREGHLYGIHQPFKKVMKDDKMVESIDLGQKPYYVFGRNIDMAGILLLF
jgi:hypothetical protein